MNISKMRITNQIIKTLLIVGIVYAILLFPFAEKSYAQTNKNMDAMNDTLKMQSKVKGNGEPLVLVGGGLTGWESWKPFVDTFIAKNRKVILVQLLSVQYGLENRDLPDNYSLETESHALHATLDSLSINFPVDIVAWSYGALTSLDYALDHPEKIRTLTLIEPPAIWVLRETGRFDSEIKESSDFFMSLEGDITIDMLADFLVHAGMVPPGKSPRDLPQWDDWVPFRQSLRNTPYPVLFRDSIQRLKEFERPVLLVKGTGSSNWLHNVIDGLEENIPNARVVEFPGGHAPHIVSTEKFLPELEKFHKEMK